MCVCVCERMHNIAPIPSCTVLQVFTSTNFIWRMSFFVFFFALFQNKSIRFRIQMSTDVVLSHKAEKKKRFLMCDWQIHRLYSFTWNRDEFCRSTGEVKISHISQLFITSILCFRPVLAHGRLEVDVYEVECYEYQCIQIYTVRLRWILNNTSRLVGYVFILITKMCWSGVILMHWF